MPKCILTIPLKPIYENEQFQIATPVLKAGVINAIYWMMQRNRLSLPLPPLEPAIGLCYSSYLRYRDDIRNILLDVIPKIRAIKQTFDYRKEKQALAQNKKRILNKKINERNTTFSDKNEHTQIIPIASPPEKSRFHPGQHDHVARKQAIENNAKEDDVWLSDS